MNPYELERMAAQRQADYVKEARAVDLDLAAPRGRRLSFAVARALRGVADWLDGGRGQATHASVNWLL